MLYINNFFRRNIMLKSVRVGYAIKNICKARSKGFTSQQIADHINSTHGRNITTSDIDSAVKLYQGVRFTKTDLKQLEKDTYNQLNNYDFSAFEV